MFFFKLYVLTVPVFLLIDMIWLGVVAKGFYRKNLDYLLSPQPNWAAAIGFYLLFIVGILVLVVQPALEKDSFVRAALLGGLFGLIAYATYDMTNLATIRNWPVRVAVVDMLWGTVLCAVVSMAAFGFGKWLS